MAKIDGCLIIHEYNDLYKFKWPVMLDTQARLYFDIKCLVEIFNDSVLSCNHTNQYNITQTIGNDDNTYDTTKLKFCTYDQLKQILWNDAIISEKFLLVLNQYLLTQLPPVINQHLDKLKLQSLFDVQDFWTHQKTFDQMLKYWLFRYKIITMNKKDNDGKEHVDVLINNLNLQFNELKNIKDPSFKLHTYWSFTQLLIGTTGLLQILLGWN
ncbi:hypothetical protein [Epinotia aporema granulovirus]|uniref:Uncharacterized protein n=1 Tax=Epinotia aporema granulovirus TaxID=166056 RepID=K4EQE0_9BBAC|nr:hypothetical protein [Epinotia aporema granulovirus]AER41463.1 hypothetical protein [Epinotia aporema granulovirus]